MKLTTTALLISAIAFSASVYAGPSANRTKDGGSLLENLFSTSEENPQTAAKPHAASATTDKAATVSLDGVWQSDNGQLLLLKQVRQTLFLSGSNSDAVWQAQCSMDKSPIYCLGYGSGTEQDFHYNGHLTRSANGLNIDWHTTGRKLGDKHTGQTQYHKAL